MEADAAKLIGAGLACIGMGGAGVGLGSLFGNFLSGALRNPAAADGQFGRLIEIDHGFGIKTRYAHLNEIHVKKGDVVTSRQKIGTVGTSGRSTGPHVHYEVLFNNKPQNPAKFLTAGQNVFKR